MLEILHIIEQILESTYFLLAVKICACLCKLYMLIGLIYYGVRLKSTKSILLFFIGAVLMGSAIVDISWALKLLRLTHVPAISLSVVYFSLRMAWVFTVIQYLSLTLFIESLLSHKLKLQVRHWSAILFGAFLCTYLLYIAVFNFHLIAETRPYYEITAYQIIYFYTFIIIIPTIYYAIQAIRKKLLPKILTHQLKIFISLLVIPHLALEFFTANPFSFSISYFMRNYTFNSISTILLTYAIYFSARKMMGLRFLNFTNHVQTQHTFNFIDDFRDVLEQLALITNSSELTHISQGFFKEAFTIPLGKARLYMRTLEGKQEPLSQDQSDIVVHNHVENFISEHDTESCLIAKTLHQSKILIRDEIEFTNFYQATATNSTILEFLTTINADIFVPIYEQHTITGYIIVEHNARPKKLYSAIERDEMVIYAGYLSNIINLLRHRNLDALIVQEKELKEELYHKHQEINQCKESIRSFLRNTQERAIGIVFCKGKNFIFGNQAAQELIAFDITAQDDHPLTQTLKQLVQDIQKYKTLQTIAGYDGLGNRLMFSGVLAPEEEYVIITVYYPDITDIIKLQRDLLKDPSEWDYLLYLETTASGQLINQLIPGSGETLLNFKIDLLKTALSKKATLLVMPEEDLMPTIEILHHISLRQTLHTISLTAAEKNHAVAIQLFGINPLFGTVTEPLLERLHNTGTLYIQNIHFLSLETQNALAEFLHYGFFHIFKSDRKMESSVRVICSTNKNLQMLVDNGTFSLALFTELKKTSLSMPPLLALSAHELHELVDGFTEQALKTKSIKSLLELTDKEKNTLLHQHPVSLQEFKELVYYTLVNKSTKKKLTQDIEFDPAYTISDPELSHAVRLGKHALKDSQTMSLLWNKFKNQTKIATLLNVNRSSVNRRCKEFKLISEDEP